MKNNDGENPKVKIFGREIGSHEDCCDDHFFHNHYHHHGNGIWGIVILFSGIILLLNNLNVIPWQFWNHVKVFWPTLLILMGIRFVLGRDIVSRLIITILTLLVVAYVIIYGLYQVGSPLINLFPLQWLYFFNSISHNKYL